MLAIVRGAAAGQSRSECGSLGHWIFATSGASFDPLYLALFARKRQNRIDLDAVICWLTGYDDVALAQHLAGGGLRGLLRGGTNDGRDDDWRGDSWRPQSGGHKHEARAHPSRGGARAAERTDSLYTSISGSKCPA